ITSPLTNVTLPLEAGKCYATFTYTPTATDNCTAAGAIVMTVTPPAGTQLAAGSTTTVTVTATDADGNATSSTFTVTVATDTEKPVITSPLSNISLPLEAGKCYATFTYTPTGSDNCTPAASLTTVVTPASGTQLAAGSTTTVTVTVTD